MAEFILGAIVILIGILIGFIFGVIATNSSLNKKEDN